MKGIFVTSNSTGAGKTTISKEISLRLRDKINLKVRKPVESGCLLVDNKLLPKDAIELAKACHSKEDLNIICPYRFQQAVNPEKASKDLGQTLTLKSLLKACKKNSKDGFFIIEGAGGIYSPIANKALNVDLAKKLQLPLVLVVNDELGAISQALLTIDAAYKNKLDVLCLVLNNIKDSKLSNYKDLKRYTKIPIICFSLKDSDNFWQEFQILLKPLL